jgi:hypothetical protein
MSSSSIISGGIGPTVAFLLVVSWDTLKDRRDIGRHDQAVIVAMRMELATNLPVVKKNQEQDLQNQLWGYDQLLHRLQTELVDAITGADDMLA